MNVQYLIEKFYSFTPQTQSYVVSEREQRNQIHHFNAPNDHGLEYVPNGMCFSPLVKQGRRLGVDNCKELTSPVTATSVLMSPVTTKSVLHVLCEESPTLSHADLDLQQPPWSTYAQASEDITTTGQQQQQRQKDLENLHARYGCHFPSQAWMSRDLVNRCKRGVKKLNKKRNVVTFRNNAAHDFWNPKERPFSCNICGRRFKQKPHRDSHELVVHYKARNYKCHVCLMSFGSKSNLNRHKTAKHKQKIQTTSVVFSEFRPVISSLTHKTSDKE